MSSRHKLSWDTTGVRRYDTGVSNVVLYPADEGAYPLGVSWSGITSIKESPSGGEPEAFYADNIKYLNLVAAEELKGSISAYTYPDEFGECDGSKEIAKGISIGQQPRKPFGLCYKSIYGNDTKLNDYAYKLHLIYGALAAPTDSEHNTVNDNPELNEWSWDFSTTPVSVATAGCQPTASVEINSAKVSAANMKALEDVLYGVDADEYSADAAYQIGEYCVHGEDTYKCTTAITEGETWTADHWTQIDPNPRLPLPDELLAIITQA